MEDRRVGAAHPVADRGGEPGHRDFARLADMPRLAVLVVLLLAMFWQSAAMARIGSSVNVLADPEHAALHWNLESHHHHDDGTYHLGDSAGSSQHVLIDPVSATAALLMAGAPAFQALGSLPPVVEHPAPRPDLALGGLFRPPRPHA
jgi:hypothetical protein